VDAARTTWPTTQWQLAHISNGREFFTDRRHSDLIAEMPDAYRGIPWIEVEAKHKEIAIRRLQMEWLAQIRD
jgi:UV DNA damage endonuclease